MNNLHTCCRCVAASFALQSFTENVTKSQNSSVKVNNYQVTFL